MNSWRKVTTRIQLPKVLAGESFMGRRLSENWKRTVYSGLDKGSCFGDIDIRFEAKLEHPKEGVL